MATSGIKLQKTIVIFEINALQNAKVDPVQKIFKFRTKNYLFG